MAPIADPATGRIARMTGVRGGLLLLGMALLLPGCALRPLYAGGSDGATAEALASVAVDPIPGRAGYLVRSALVDRLGGEARAPRYRLAVSLDDRIEGLGVRADDTVTRERRTVRARYTLTEAATGRIVAEESAATDAGIDVVSSEYATIAAENSALENIATRIADRILIRLAEVAGPDR